MANFTMPTIKLPSFIAKSSSSMSSASSDTASNSDKNSEKTAADSSPSPSDSPKFGSLSPPLTPPQQIISVPTTASSTTIGTTTKKSGRGFAPLSRFSIPWVFIVSILPAIFNFIAIFLIWFGITSPVPTRIVNTALLRIRSGPNAAHRLAHSSGAPVSAFSVFPTDTSAGIWLGLLGSCARQLESASDEGSKNHLFCEHSNLNVNYDDSIALIAETLPVMAELTQAINPIPGATHAIPAVSPIVFVVSFILLFLGFVLAIWGNFPRFGSERNSVGRTFNTYTLGHKNWLIENDRGKWILNIATVLLALSWVLGFTATVAIHGQFSGTAHFFNQGYSLFLANATTTATGEPLDPASLPPLLAADTGPAYIWLWLAFAMVAYSAMATSTATADYPTYLSRSGPTATLYGGWSDDYGTKNPGLGLTFNGNGYNRNNMGPGAVV